MGRNRWLGSNKTVEGTVAFVIIVLFSSFLLLQTGAFIGLQQENHTDAFKTQIDWRTYTFVVFLTGITFKEYVKNKGYSFLYITFRSPRSFFISKR